MESIVCTVVFLMRFLNVHLRRREIEKPYPTLATVCFSRSFCQLEGKDDICLLFYIVTSFVTKMFCLAPNALYRICTTPTADALVNAKLLHNCQI